jgi:tetratricopeptide (TPR) repeat protein
LEYHQQALTIAKKIGDRKNQANQLGNIGVVYTYTDDCQKALEYYQQALTIAKEIGDKNAQAVWLGNIGFSHQELQEYTWALDYLNQALQLSRELGIRANEACLLGMLGITHKSLNNFEQALQYLQAGLQLTQTLGIPAMWACHFFIGIIAEKQGKPEEAVTHYKQAVEKIESVREKLKTKEVQTSFMRATKKTEVYERLIKLLIELGREEEALEYLERSKSEQLKDAFGRLRGRTEDKEEQRKLDEFGQLKERLIALETQLLEAKSGKAVENLTIQIAETKEQLEQFLTYLKDEYPELHGFLIEGNGVFKSVDYLRAQLPKGTLLIEYCLLEDFLAIFLVTSESFESKVVIVKRLQIDELVWKYRESFMQRSHRYNRDGDKLYEYLIKPIESEIEQAETVTVVPNGSLYYLPFHALSRKDNVGNRQFLLEWKRISYLSAATLLDLIQRGRADAAVTAIASGSGQGGGTREVIWASLNMLRAVIDTKLVASATIVSVGHSAQILDTWPAGKFQIVTSPQIIEEMRRVLFYERIRKRSFKHSN